ncbi:MAG TPA: energy transducer TonB [Pyrinomonadaceae bacterium]
MRTLISATTVCLIATFCVAGASPRVSPPTTFQQWQRYTVKGEEFSVSLPALPAMTTDRYTNLNPRYERTVRVLGSYASGVAYAINTFENPRGMSLEEFINYIKARRSRLREWKESTEISLNGFPGKQFELSEREVPGAVQFFRTKNHLYQFEAFGAFIGDPRMQEFFSSIVLGKKPDSINVQDGIGAQPDDSQSQSGPVIAGKDADRKAVILTKPEPSYTDSARQQGTKGAVVLKAVFASTGGITGIQVVSGLPNGLTEKAVAAVKQIRFVPAMKNGQMVSVQLQLEYNFNIY